MKNKTRDTVAALQTTARRVSFIAANWWWLLIVACIGLLLVFLVFVVPIISMVALSSTAEQHNDVSARSAQSANVITASDYGTLSEVAASKNVPWQILAVLSRHTQGTVGSATPTPAAGAAHTGVGVNVGGSPTEAENRASTPLEWALLQEGKPYVWAGIGPDSYDCSGLVYAAGRQFGMSIPRTAGPQHDDAATYGAQVVPLEERRKGDLMFMYWGAENPTSGIDHVVIVLDEKHVLEAHGNQKCTSGVVSDDCVVRILDYSSRLKYARSTVVRIPGFSDGDETYNAPQGAGSSGINANSGGGSGGGVRVPQFTGGEGRFHLDPAVVSDAGKDYMSDALFVASSLSDATAGVNFGAGITGGENGLREDPSDEAQRAVEAVKKTWVQAIASLPIVSMSEAKAVHVFDAARLLYMGAPQDSSQNCRVQKQSHNNLVEGDAELVVFGDTENGQKQVRLDEQQIANARIIFDTLVEFNASEKEMVTTYATALVESGLRNYANSSVPGSLNLPHDAVGSDHDSVGVFQQRALTGGWGSYEQIMDIRMSTMNFLGVEGRVATARGLRQISGWESMSVGELAQTVQVSAFPDRYGYYVSAAMAIVDAMGDVVCDGGASGRWVLPVEERYKKLTSVYGMRVHPVLGTLRLHTGIDFGAAMGSPIFAVADGQVSTISYGGGYGNLVCVDHGDGVESCYAHMTKNSIVVSEGQQVHAGETIASVGSEGWSTGAHLHFEIRIDGQFTDPEEFLKGKGALS